jgi:hypothetical protein
MSSLDVNTPLTTVVFIFAYYVRSVALRISWICSVNHLRGLVVTSAHRRGTTMAADKK